MHYVIGDPHGCYDELTRLVNKINEADSDATIIFTGDFIDRGPRVIDTLNFFMEHIKPSGKYQCVLGNHEDMVLTWWNQVKDDWTDDSDETIENLEKIHYGFDEKLKAAGLFKKAYLEKVVTFFQSLPLRIDLKITSPSGKVVDFTVAHAFLPNSESKENPRHTYLWSREHFWGFRNGSRILVHGHTPTHDFDYLLRNSSGRPGMIVYSHNAINVDGGCCYFPVKGDYCPCLLCGICLETLEEFYSDTLEGRFLDHMEQFDNEALQVFGPERCVKYKMDSYNVDIQQHSHGNNDSFYYKRKMLERLGRKKCDDE